MKGQAGAGGLRRTSVLRNVVVAVLGKLWFPSEVQLYTYIIEPSVVTSSAQGIGDVYLKLKKLCRSSGKPQGATQWQLTRTA